MLNVNIIKFKGNYFSFIFNFTFNIKKVKKLLINYF